MNADDMPIANQEKLNQKDCSKQKNQGDSYSQNGNHGIGHNSDGVIKDNAKVAGKIEENNSQQSQEINAQQVTVNNNLSNNSDQKTIKITKTKTERIGDREISEAVSIELPVSVFTVDLKEFLENIAGSSIKIKDADQGSIRFTLEGSEEGLKNIAESFESGELAPLLKQRFNLELESVKLTNSDSSETYPKNQNKKLLAFTIGGNVSQADIDILKAELIDTSDDDEEIRNEEKSYLAEESKNNKSQSNIVSIIWFDREIRPNDTGGDVKQVQALINQKYGTELTEDGIYGKKTIEVIKQIQTNSNLPVTGICDRRTLNVIESEPDGDNRKQSIEKKYSNKKLLQFFVLAIPVSIMAIFLWKPELIAFIFHQDRLKILFFVSCVVWFLLVVDKILGLEVSQILTELTKYLRDFLQIHNQ